MSDLRRCFRLDAIHPRFLSRLNHYGRYSISISVRFPLSLSGQCVAVFSSSIVFRTVPVFVFSALCTVRVSVPYKLQKKAFYKRFYRTPEVHAVAFILNRVFFLKNVRFAVYLKGFSLHSHSKAT